MNLKENWGKYLVFLISLTAMSGSLYFSEVVGYIPCDLCWWQRVFMYPIVFLSLIGIIKKSNELFNYVASLSFIGMCISIYHVYIQFSGSESSFCSGAVECNIKYIEWLGFITIPVLCLTAFALINVIIVIKYVIGRTKV